MNMMFLSGILSSLIASVIIEGSKSIFVSLWEERSSKRYQTQLRRCFEEAVDSCVGNVEIARKLKETLYLQYLDMLKRELIDGMAFDENGTLYKDILVEFENRVRRNKILRVRLFWIYVTQIKKDVAIIKQELSEISHRINQIRDIALKNQQRLQDVANKSDYTLPPIVIETADDAVSDSCLQRPALVETINKRIEENRCLFLYGPIYSGKSVTSTLVSQQRIEERPVIWRMEYEQTYNLRTIIESIPPNSMYRFFVIDALPQYTVSQMEDLCGLIKKKVEEGILFLVNTRSLDGYCGIPEKYFATMQLPMLTGEEIVHEEPCCSLSMANLIVTVGHGYPSLVSLLLTYLKKHDWQLTQDDLVEFLNVPERGEITSVVTQKVREIISDIGDIQLLSRLTLFGRGFGEDDVVKLAGVHPVITTPRARLNRLVCEGLVSQSETTLRVSGLVQQMLQIDLVEPELKDCAHTIVSITLSKRVISATDACNCILLLLKANEHDAAGQFYIACIQKLLSVKPESIDKTSILLQLWRDMPLPEEMNIDVKTTIRGFQLQLFFSLGIPCVYVLGDLEECIKQLPVQSPLRIPSACGAIIYRLKQNNVAAAIALSPYMSNFMPVADGIPELSVLQADFTTRLPVLLLEKVDNIQALFEWFLYYETLSGALPEIEAMTIRFVVNKIIREGDEENLLRDIINRVRFAPKLHAFLDTCVGRLMLVLSHQKRFPEVAQMYEQYQDCVSRPIGQLWLHHAMSCSLFDQNDMQGALEHWRMAVDCIPLDTEPDLCAFAVVNMAYILAQQNDFPAALNVLLSVIGDERFKDFYSEVGQASLHGELAIAYWNSGDKKKTFSQLQKVYEYIWQHRMDNSEDVDLLIIKLNICAHYYYFGKGTIPPTHGVFYIRNEHLLQHLNDDRRSLIGLIMFMLGSSNGLGVEEAYKYACHSIDGGEVVLQGKSKASAMFNEMLPLLMGYADVPRIEYVVKANLSLISQLQGENVHAELIFYEPISMLCLQRIILQHTKQEDWVTLVIHSIIESARQYLGEDIHFACLRKSIRQNDAVLANGASEDCRYCAQLYCYAQLNVRATFHLLYAIIHRLKVHPYYIHPLLRQATQAIAEELFASHRQSFSWGRSTDPLVALNKVAVKETDSESFAKCTLRIILGFALSDIPISSVQKEYLES